MAKAYHDSAQPAKPFQATAELAFSFANHVEPIIANRDDKPLIPRGAVRNPKKTSKSSIGPSMSFGFRIRERDTGNGKCPFRRRFAALRP